jgi:hypothetical protein
MHPLALLLVLPFATAALSYGISRLLRASAGQTRKSTFACLAFSFLWDLPALFLVSLNQTF